MRWNEDVSRFGNSLASICISVFAFAYSSSIYNFELVYMASKLFIHALHDAEDQQWKKMESLCMIGVLQRKKR